MAKHFFIITLLLLSINAQSSGLTYLTPASLDLSDFPAPPPVNSSLDLLDLLHVLEIQNSRSSSECERASREATGYATSFFAPPYGPLSLEEAERLVEFQEILFKEINFFSRILKKKWGRERPFLRDNRVSPCIPLHHSNAYPSGHAAVSYLAAKTFSLIYPEKREQFEKRALEIAHGRVLGGVHYPLDVEAGRELGSRVFEALQKSKLFHQDVWNLRP